MLSKLNPIPFSSDRLGKHGAPAQNVVPMVRTAGDGEPGFDVLFGQGPHPMWIIDIESMRFLAVNDAAVRRYGWSREEFLQMTADKLRLAADSGSFLNVQQPAAQRMEAWMADQSIWRHITKSGEILSVKVAWQRLNFRGRSAVLATITDRSEQQRAEEETRELASVLNLASDAIIVCNLDQQILFWNKGAEQIYGWTSHEAIGKGPKEILGMEYDVTMKCMQGLLARGEWAGEMQHTRKDGSKATINSRWTLARDSATGLPKSVLLINTDVTETKKLESQFLRNQRLESIGTLASGIAHDLNNILSPILMAADILRSSKLGAEANKMISIIEGSAERGAGIVKQVLTFARGVEGERVLLQPKHLASDMAKVMHQTFPKNIDITTSFPNDLWMVSGDATQLHQVLLNLCVNARDAMGEKGGKLRVACENVDVDEELARSNPGAQTGPYVCFSVSDTGSGIPADVIEKIFDPFFTTKEQGKGTGLGLATVIGIVNSHKGFLTLQSRVGIGTTFRIFIPATKDGSETDDAKEDTAQLQGHGELVLVVDDEASVRDAVVATLECNGYRCYTAEDGTDALALYFERREIAVVVTDLHMGMMDGITLTRSLQRLNPAVKVIVSSGHVDEQKRATLASVGIHTVLEKPYTSDKLLRSIKDLLAAPAR